MQKQAQRVVWDGNKIISIVLLWERTIHTVVVWHEVQQGERVFFLSVSRCGIYKRQAHVRGVTRWEAVILNYECSIRRVFPVWHNRRDSSLAAWKGQLCKETMRGNYYPRAYRTRHVIFVHCLLNWMLTTNICPTHPTRKALKKPCARSS